VQSRGLSILINPYLSFDTAACAPAATPRVAGHERLRGTSLGATV
jgi:hypothetical protein